MKKEDINQIIGITESFKLPERLMEILMDDSQRENVFDQFMVIGESLDHDWFTQYFEEEHSNKSKMAQDFTPSSVTKIIGELAGDFKSCSDIASGTGGITIGMWIRNKDARYNCYELSERAVPLLIFNLAIRNINASVTRIDILTGEVFEHYEIVPGDKYASIKKCEFDEFELTDVCVSNPPFSLKYNPKNDTRFPEFAGMLPTNYADYVFLAFGLHLSKDPIHLLYVLPHGVLFRGAKEEKFRRFLIDKNLIKTVIGLPDKLFLNTGIPTLIMEIKKSDTVLFADMSKEFEKRGKINVITDPHLNTIASSVRLRKNIEKMTHIADIKEIKSNDYNLNIPRYVDMFEYEELPDMTDALLEMINDDMDRMSLETQVIALLEQMEGTSEEEDRKLKNAIDQAKKMIRKRVKELEII